MPGTKDIQLLYIEKEENREMEICLSDLFNITVDRDYRVYGKLIDEGVCIDFGNINTFVKYKVLVENKGVSAKGRVLQGLCKHKDNFKRILSMMTLFDVIEAVNRAKKIMQTKHENGYVLQEYKGYHYYKENPSLAIWESIEKILMDCGLM